MKKDKAWVHGKNTSKHNKLRAKITRGKKKNRWILKEKTIEIPNIPQPIKIESILCGTKKWK